MSEFLDLAFSTINLPLTCLMLVLILYWVFTMLSGIDFDVDFDVDMDTDFDIDTDSILEGGNANFENISNTEITKENIITNRRKKLKWWQIILIYFNFVGLPFMFTFTVFIFTWWVVCMLATEILSTSENIYGLIIFFGSIIPSLIITKVFTAPFKKFFVHLNKNGDVVADYIGRKGVSLSAVSGDKMGRAEVLIDGSPMNVYVKSLHGQQIEYNDNILIIKQSIDKNFFYVESYNEL